MAAEREEMDAKLAAARGADRHVVAQLLETAQAEGYGAVNFTIRESISKDSPGKRRITVIVERELDDLESIL